MGPLNGQGSPVVFEPTLIEAVTFSRNGTTATAAGSVSGDGNASVTITSAKITGSPLVLAVPVLNGDLPADWAAKVRTALQDTLAVVEHYNVSGSTTAITLEAKDKSVADATLNIALATGTATGITTAATSVAANFYDGSAKFLNGGKVRVNDEGVKNINVRLSGMPKYSYTVLPVTGPGYTEERILEIAEASTTATNLLMVK